jgi:hypothetical protein
MNIANHVQLNREWVPNDMELCLHAPYIHCLLGLGELRLYVAYSCLIPRYEAQELT